MNHTNPALLQKTEVYKGCELKDVVDWEYLLLK